MKEQKPIGMRLYYEGECPHCENHNCAPNPDRGMEATFWCCACKKPITIKCYERMYGYGTKRRLPTLQELEAAATKFVNTVPFMAKIALACMEKGAFYGAPHNTEELAQEA